MKLISMRFGMAALFFVVTGLSSMSLAADKIGNGGGVWVCQNAQLEVFDVMFMDVFEARREYQLNLPESNLDPLDIVKIQKEWIEKFLQNPHNITKHIEYVEKNITWIDDVINLIPDAAARISPHPSTCKQGDWTPVQLVNFTEDFRVLVRRELFHSPYMSNLEKAGVYLHEGIYSFMRTDYGDTNSVRARAIVGFLLSDLANTEKVLRIQKVLNQATPDPVNPPTSGWMCGIKPSSTSPLYTFESLTQKLAIDGALNACKKGEDPFGGGIPGMPAPVPPGGNDNPGVPPGGFPGFPGGGGFGPASDCKEVNVTCEAIQGSDKSKHCDFQVDFSGKTYRGSGRTRLEAQKEAISQCLIGEAGNNHHCYNYQNLNCN